MGWLYVPGLGELSLDSSSPSEIATVPCVTLSGKPSLRPLSWRGWKTRPWIARLSGTMWGHSMAKCGVGLWISSLRDSRANRSARLHEGEGSLPTCGESVGESSWSASLKSSFLRTLLARRDACAECAKTSKQWATMLLRSSAPMPPAWVPRSGDGDYSFLPRPTAAMNQWSPSMMKHRGSRVLVQVGGKRDRRWIEWVMGFPIGWTMNEPLGTEWSRWLQRMRSEL